MTEVICETFERLFTIVCYEITQNYYSNGKIIVDIPNVIIKQKPEETAQIKFSINMISSNKAYGHHLCSTGPLFDLCLIFKKELNNMMLCSYSYEIKCVISYLDLITGIYKNNILCFCEIERTSESINSKGEISRDLESKLLPGNKIQFIISRNLKNAQVNDHKHFLQADFFDQLFFLQQYGDVKVIVSEKVFNVHKDILSLRSDVFKAMFSHEMTENKEGLIKIENIKPEVIEEMLRYIYTYKTKNLDANMSIELYKVAHLYEINDLKDKCIEFIKFNLDSQSFISVLKFSLDYELEDLKDGVLEYIDTHEDEFVKRDDYQEFLNENLSVQSIAHILKLCTKYPNILEKVKLQSLEFIKSHSKEVIKEKEYLDLFESHHQLIKEIYMFVHK